MELWHDIETRSTEDVTECGAYRLAEDPTLEVISIHWAIDNGPVKHWRNLWEPDPIPEEYLDALMWDQTISWAHNAAFERLILNAWFKRKGWDAHVSLERQRDSAFVARSYNLPGGLDGLARACGVKKLPNLTFRPLWRHAVDISDRAHWEPTYREMLVYGDGDVTTMRHCVRALPELPPERWEEWRVSERINDTGCLADLNWCATASGFAEVVAKKAEDELDYLTSGAVTSPRQGNAAVKWVDGQLRVAGLLKDDERIEKTVRLRNEDGVGFTTIKKESLDKATRAQLREWLLERRGADVDHVLDVLDVMDESSASAPSKYAAALRRANSDGVVRGQYIASGAAQTGRFASVGMQLHNMIRAKAPDDVRAARQAAVGEKGSAPALGKLLRTTFMAATPEDRLVWGDWSAIEARVAPWLAIGVEGDATTSAQELLRLFRTGADVYLRAASDIEGRPVTDPKDPARQIGKVAVLALGFMGGAGAFNSMARNYGLKPMPDDKVKGIVKAWRDANQWAPMLAAGLERAALRAFRQPGYGIEVGRLFVLYVPNVIGGSLMIFLPDGRPLVYPECRIVRASRFEGAEPQEVMTFRHPVFGRSALWGGGVVENVTQGTAASLLRQKLVEVDAAGQVVVLHTHDEIVLETTVDAAPATEAWLKRVMTTNPDWAHGLPLDAACETGYRYYAQGSLPQ